MIYLIIRQIGDLTDVQGAYKEYSDATTEMKTLKNNAHAKGYTDFVFYIKSFELL